MKNYIKNAAIILLIGIVFAQYEHSSTVNRIVYRNYNIIHDYLPIDNGDRMRIDTVYIDSTIINLKQINL